MLSRGSIAIAGAGVFAYSLYNLPLLVTPNTTGFTCAATALSASLFTLGANVMRNLCSDETRNTKGNQENNKATIQLTNNVLSMCAIAATVARLYFQ